MYYNFGLVGYPLNHSLSPSIHNYFIYINKINGGYNCFELRNVKGICKLLNILKEYRFSGLNITLPYKEEIIKYVDELSEVAVRTGSVNTLHIKNNYIKGYNTDIYGFREMLRYNNISLKNKKVVILGAGGVSKSVLTVVLEEDPKQIDLLCRDIQKGDDVIKNLKINNFKNIFVKDIGILKDGYECDVIINATSAGIKNSFDINLSNVKINYYAIDLQYNLRGYTYFLNAIENKKVTMIDGIDMLIFQALKSFEIWTECNFNINIREVKKILLGKVQ